MLYLIPLDAFALAHSTDINEVVSNKELLEPMGLGCSTSLHNFDGYLLWKLGGKTDIDFYLSSAYSQYFRNGCIESLRVIKPVEDMTIRGDDIERWMRESLTDYLKLLKIVGISLPIVIMVSLLNAHGYKIGIVRNEFMGGGYLLTSKIGSSLPPQGIVQDNLLFPDILLEDYDDNISTHLYSIFQT